MSIHDKRWLELELDQTDTMATIWMEAIDRRLVPLSMNLSEFTAHVFDEWAKANITEATRPVRGKNTVTGRKPANKDQIIK